MAKAAQVSKLKPAACTGHGCVGSWTDPEMIALMRNEARPVITSFLKQQDLETPHFVEGDVVIHYRCGDVISSNNPQYGLIPFKWYKENIPASAKRLILVGNFKASREVDKKGEGMCAIIKNAFVQYLTDALELPISLRSNSVNEDFAAMMFAPVLISSISTFSLWAGMLSKQKVILPRCSLFFHCETPMIAGISWANVTMLESNEITELDRPAKVLSALTAKTLKEYEDIIDHMTYEQTTCVKRS